MKANENYFIGIIALYYEGPTFWERVFCQSANQYSSYFPNLLSYIK